MLTQALALPSITQAGGEPDLGRSTLAVPIQWATSAQHVKETYMQVSNLEKDQSLAQLFAFELTLLVGDLQAEWKRCNMLANYIAAYVAYQFIHQERAENIISTIANELLEAVVFLAPQHSHLYIRCRQFEQGLLLEAKHIICAETVGPYLTFLEGLNSDSLDQQYVNLLTTESKPAEYFNQLGLLMLMHDFGTHLTTYRSNNSDEICTRLFIATQEFLK